MKFKSPLPLNLEPFTLNLPLKSIDAQLQEVFARFPQVVLVLLFGSVAAGQQRTDSDLDVAVAAGYPIARTGVVLQIGQYATLDYHE